LRTEVIWGAHAARVLAMVALPSRTFASSRFNASIRRWTYPPWWTLQRINGDLLPPGFSFVERCDTLSFLEIA
jgi:hypothetical protein